MIKRRNIDAAELQAETAFGLKSNSEPKNQIEALEQENEKLRAQIQDQERELLRIYRRLLDCY